VLINSVVLIVFAASFFRPKSSRDWHTPRFLPRWMNTRPKINQGAR